jgi:hypothetical protein
MLEDGMQSTNTFNLFLLQQELVVGDLIILFHFHPNLNMTSCLHLHLCHLHHIIYILRCHQTAIKQDSKL